MKPLVLEMQGFGPYGNRVQVDFTKFAPGGLYLVTGETGSGKTFIFDALCYALFGEVSGGERKNDMLRTLGLADNVESYVQLTFVCKGKEYCIRRKPAYLRAKKKGTGLVMSLATVELVTEQATLLRAEEVNAKIYDLIGLTAEQFKQIVMVAQGKFAQILQKSTKERQELLREIFSTGLYVHLEAKAKAENNRLGEGYKTCKQEIEHKLQDISAGNEEFGERLQTLRQAEYVNVAKVLELLAAMEEVDTRQVQDLEVELTALQEAGTKLEKSLDKAQKRLEYQEKLVLAEKEWQKKVVAFSECQAKKEQALQEEPDMAAKDQVLQQLRDRAKELMDYKNSLQKGRENLLKAKTDYVGACDYHAQLQEKYMKLSNRREALGKFSEKCNETQIFLMERAQEKADVEASIRRLQHCLEVAEEIGKAEQKLQQAQVNYLTKEKAAAAANKNFQYVQTLFLRGQAGILAKGLKMGVACPVCGSVRHPHLAPMGKEVPSEEQWKAAEKKSNGAAAEREQAAGAAAQAMEWRQNRCTSFLNMVGEFYEQKFPGGEERKLIGKLNADKQKLEGEIAALNKLMLERQQELGMAVGASIVDFRKKAEVSFQNCQQQEQEVGNKLTAVLGEVHLKEGVLAKELDTLQQELRLESSDLAGSDAGDLTYNREGLLKSVDLTAEQSLAFVVRADKQLEEVKQKGAALSGEVKKYRDNLEKLNRDLTEADKEKSALKAQIQTLQDVLASLQTEGTAESLQEKLRQNQEVLGVVKDQKAIVQQRLWQNDQVAKGIRERQAAMANLEESMQELDNLYRTLSGNLNTEQASKISFETYMQQSYFDRILAFANFRLLKISRGRYKLVRKDDAQGKGNAKVGLDLDVHDARSGKQRSANSLSGGETFMASLALALGMADEVKASAGGIQINTMFIDEGFGSLSKDYLDATIDILNDLASKEYQVGVISHIEELKERVEQQIVVSKMDNGYSTITVEV